MAEWNDERKLKAAGLGACPTCRHDVNAFCSNAFHLCDHPLDHWDPATHQCWACGVHVPEPRDPDESREKWKRDALSYLAERDEARNEAARLRDALRNARYYVSKHDADGHTLAIVDRVLFGSEAA